MNELDRYMNGTYTEAKSSPGSLGHSDYWNLLLFLFVVGLLTVSHVSGLSKIMILYGFILTAAFIIYSLYNRSLRILPELIIYIAWIIWALLGVTVAVDEALFMEKLMTVIQISVLIFLVSGMVSLKRNMTMVMLALIIGGLIVFLSSLYTGTLLEAGESDSRVRASGLAANPNGFAYHMMFVVYAALLFWKKNASAIWRIILLSIVGLSALGIVYSGSRTGILGFIVFLSLWWLFCVRKRLPEHPIKIYVVLIVILFALYQFIDYVLFRTYVGERILYFQDSSSLRRLELYKEGLNMIIQNPLFGIGLSNFGALDRLGQYSHSNYIELASTTGIVGCFIFYSIYVMVWQRLNRIKRIYSEPHCMYTINLFKAAILTILFQSLTTVNYSSKPTWIFLAAVIGYSWSLERSLLGLISAHKRYVRRFEEAELHGLSRRDIV